MAGIATYIKDSYEELTTRVTWPTWKELQSSAIVVFIAALIISLIIFVMDFVFGVNTNKIWHGVLGYFYDFLS